VQLHLNEVLEDIGVITRVEGVAVAQHKLEFLKVTLPRETGGEIRRHYPLQPGPAGNRCDLRST
jgi:hypothetical protein